MEIWEEVYAELVNKIRWSLATTASTSGCNLNYSEARAIASLLAGDALAALKAKSQSPDIRWTKEGFKQYLTELVPTASPTSNGRKTE